MGGIPGPIGGIIQGPQGVAAAVGVGAVHGAAILWLNEGKHQRTDQGGRGCILTVRIALGRSP